MKKLIICSLLILLGLNGWAQEWIDITDEYVINPRYDNNEYFGWEGTALSGYNPMGNAEHYQKNYDTYQVISGLKSGTYRVSLQAFYRSGSSNDDYTHYNSINASNYQYAKLYASSSTESKESPIALAASGAVNLSLGGATSSVGGKNIPNNMEAAYRWFNAGYYNNSVEVKVGSDGKLTIGIRKNYTLTGDWTCLDNWKLEYYGTITKVISIILSTSSLDMVKGESRQLTASVYPSSATFKKMEWSSTNESVATVDQYGMVKAAGAGTCYIKAKATDGSSVEKSCSVTVTSNPATAENVVINEIMVANIDVYRDPSTNFGSWVELYNPTNKAVMLGGLYVTDDAGNLKKNQLVDYYGALPANGYAVLNFDHHEVWTKLSYRQIDDKLNIDGGTIIISDGENIIAQQTYPAAIGRTSYARTSDGGSTWSTTGNPSPGSSNAAAGGFANVQLEAPIVDKDGCVFSGSLIVKVNIPTGSTLRYTTDGSTPTLSNGYTSTNGQFYVTGSSCYRFRLFQNGYLPSKVVTRSYIKSTNEPFPVISVVTDPANISGSNDYGLFQEGQYGRPGNGQTKNCNWNMEWDRPVSFEFITTDNECVVAQECDFAMCGGWSRAYTPHSFKLKASKTYDLEKTFKFPLFKEKPFINNKTLQIRNGGNDTGCRIKDASIQQIVARSGLYVDYQAWQPVHVFINGSSHGVLNMREPNNKHHAYANYGIESEELEQFEMSPDSGYVQMVGTGEYFKKWYDLSSDAANASAYSEICNLVDIDEYINYMAVELYTGNWDWPQNNVKGYRSLADGKFHFVLFDMDGTLSTDTPLSTFAGKQYYNFDTLHGFDYSREVSIEGKRNYREIEFVTIFMNMLNNSEFKKKFVDAYCIVAGSVYNPERVNSIVDEMSTYLSSGNYVNPYNTANSVKNSFANRANSLTNHLANFLSLSEERQQVSLEANIDDAKIMVNNIQLADNRFNGYLFAPVTLKAVAPNGYKFLGWTSEDGVAKTSSLFDKGSTWYYADTDISSSSWKSSANAFNRNGKSPLGYGKTVSSTLAANKTAYYFGKTINIDKNINADDIFTLDYIADDGFVIYVNGSEAGRYNMPAGTIRYSSVATTYAHDNPDSGKMTLNTNLFRKGSNYIAVEVHNNQATSSDIYWDASLLITQKETDSFLSTNAEYTMPTEGAQNIKAMFAKETENEKIANGIPPVMINEVSANNASYINDYNKNSDWVELYNTTDKDIDIAGMYLSDNKSNPQKYRIVGNGNAESTIIKAHDYKLIWCDGLEPIGQLHAPFKLDNADGAIISIQNEDGSWADRMEYREQTLWQTYGRFPDGGKWTSIFEQPTINKTNRLNAYDADYVETNSNDIAITLALPAGWNWTSHNLAENVDKSRFTSFAQCIRSQNNELFYDEYLGWVGNVKSLNAAQGYKLQLKRDAEITLRGCLYDVATPVNLQTGWNWIGIPLYNTTTIEAALSKYTASEGDMIVGFDAFATFEDGRWTGSLTSLTPGQGYLMKTDRSQQFCWTSLQNNTRSRRYTAPSRELNAPWNIDSHSYPNVMNIIATLAEEDKHVLGDNTFCVGVFSGDECRGVSENIDGKLYINVHGNGNEPLSFRIVDVDGKCFTANESVILKQQTLLGSNKSPFTLSINQSTEITSLENNNEIQNITYYNIKGQKISSPSAGLYIEKTTYRDGRVKSKKIIR